MSKKSNYKYDGEKATDSFGTIAWCSESSAIAIIAQFERRDKQIADLQAEIKRLQELIQDAVSFIHNTGFHDAAKSLEEKATINPF